MVLSWAEQGTDTGTGTGTDTGTGTGTCLAPGSAARDAISAARPLLWLCLGC